MIKAVAYSNVGNIRSNHEDNYLLGAEQYIDAKQQSQMINSYCTCKHTFVGEYGIFAVCDGMGGHSAGEVASFEAVKWISDNYINLLEADDTLDQCISNLNQHICNCAAQNSNYSDMGTTLSAIIVEKQQIFFVNAGDSRIYSCLNGKLTKLSVDHTEGQRLLDLKLLTTEEYDEFSSRKALYKYLGRKGDLHVDIIKSEIYQGAYYMICSDGITDVISEQRLREFFWDNDNVDEIGKQIIEYALNQGNNCADNITVIILKMV